MWARNLVLIGIWACGTLLAISLFSQPARLNAGDEPGAKTPAIANPSLQVNGVELAVRLSSTSPHKPGLAPHLVLIATNQTQSTREVPWSLSISTRSPSSPLARTLPASQSVWHRSSQIVIGPGKSVELSLNPNVSFRAGQIVSVDLSSGKQSITPITFSIERPETQPPLARR